MSEIPQIGRNPVYVGTLAVFVVLQAPTALAVNFGMLLAFRFITGFVGSPVLATGGASLGKESFQFVSCPIPLIGRGCRHDS